MPRAARARKVTQKEIFVVEGGASALPEQDEPLQGAPLFELAGDLTAVAKVGVIRDEPIEEGQLGYVLPDATEETIRRRWGGGTYRLQAKTEQGHHLKGGFRTIKLAGEPKFTDAVSLAKYRRLRRQEMGEDSEPQAAAKGQPSILEILEMQERKAELARAQAREDYERREAERDAAHRREMERVKLEAEAHERERKAEDDRRDRERQAAEERRERERLAEDQRRRQDQEDGRARDREFFAGMLKLNKEEAKGGGTAGLESALRVLMAAREMFGEGGSPDAITTLIGNLPAILDKSSGIASQITGQAPAAGGEEPPKDGITLSGIHGRKLAAAMQNLRSQGVDPEKVLLHQLHQLATVKVQRPGEPAANVSPPDGKQSAPPQASPAARSRRARRPARARA